MYAELEALRDRLAGIDGVQTCRIGYEQGISPQEFPIIRLIPSRMEPGRPYSKRTIELAIVYGANLPEAKDGLEAVYSALDALESDILAELRAAGGTYIATLADEDRITPYKLMQVQCRIEGATPATAQT